MDPRKTARVAGLLYLIVVVTGIFTLAYVPSKLIVWDNAALTFTQISESELLFRVSIIAGVICYTAFLILPFVLYKLLHQVSNTHAVSMVILSVVSVPFSLYNLVNKVNVLTIINSQHGVDAMKLTQLQEQVMMSLNYYDNGIQLVSFFWGLWLFPFGYLVYKSGFLPKILGLFLMAGCLGYLINFTGGFLIKDYSALGIAGYISLPASIGEIGICLWLLIVGRKTN